MMALEGPESSTGMSKTVVAVVVAIFTSMVTVPATYLINQYLERDRISIEAIEAVPEIINYGVPNEKLLSLTQDPGEIFRTEFNIWLDGQPDATRALFGGRESSFYNESEREDLLGALGRFRSHVEQLLIKVKELKERWEEVLTSGDRQSKSDLLHKSWELRVIVLEGSPSIVQPPNAKVDKSFQEKIKSLEATKQLVAEMEANAQDFKRARNGEVFIKVTFLNAGNTDGLIKSGGSLKIIDQFEEVPIVEEQGKAHKIEKRTVSEVWFKPDKEKAKKEDIARLTELVKNKTPMQGVVRVKDFRDLEIQSKVFDFPVTDS